MLNSYEIATQLKERLHLKVGYTIVDVCYMPYGLRYDIYIENAEDKIITISLSGLIAEGHIETLGKRTAFAMFEDEINDALEDIKFDDLVEYYYNKGMHMAEINKRLMTRGLDR